MGANPAGGADAADQRARHHRDAQPSGNAAENRFKRTEFEVALHGDTAPRQQSLEAGGTLENAQAMAAHESPRTTKL
jgi:hypothetical protein